MRHKREKALIKREVFEGIHIFKQGDPGREAFLIEDGKVEIFIEEEGGKRTLAVLSRGEIIGEMSLIKGHERCASAIAKSKTHLVVIDENTMEEKMKHADPLVKAMLKLLIGRLYNANCDIFD